MIDLLWTVGIGLAALGVAMVVIGLMIRFVRWVWNKDNIGF